MGGFRLDQRRYAMPNRVGANGARIAPGESGRSRLYQKVAGSQAGLQMPPTGALSQEQIGTIKAWIDQGADWPDELSGEAPQIPPDPRVIRIMEALRNGDRQGFDRVLAENPKVINSRGKGGSTPLMYAALYGQAETVRRLLDKGADPNLKNDDDCGTTVQRQSSSKAAAGSRRRDFSSARISRQRGRPGRG
jgi:hypothetical protein